VNAASVNTFIGEEVERQGFTPGTESFDKRYHWMWGAWRYAVDASVVKTQPDVRDVVYLGSLVEPGKNYKGIRTVGVQVGGRICPQAAHLPGLMSGWVKALSHLTPDEAYLEFEKIHPFVDGNGRVGKVIHNWLNKTLDEPVLVQDFFGHGIP